MSLRAMRLSGRRRLVAVGLAAVTMVAVVGGVAFMSFHTRTALGSGSGGGCISTTGPVCTFKDSTAYVDFSSVSADGCIFTDMQASLYSNLSTPGHTATQNVAVFLTKWDYCNGVPLMEASDVDPNTGLSTFNGSFQISSDLTTATAHGTAAMYDWISGTQLYTATLDLTFKGYGPTSKYRDSQHFQAPGYVMNSHFAGISRSAEVSGMFTDPDGNNAAAQPTANASLVNSSGGTVQIVKS